MAVERGRTDPALAVLAGVLFAVPLVTANLTGLGIGELPLLYDAVELPRLVLTLVGALCACVLWAVARARAGAPLRVDAPLFLLLGLACWSAVSAVTALDPLHSVLGQSERLEGAVSYVLYALLYFVALQTVGASRDLKLLAVALVAAAALSAAYGLAQFLGYDPASYLVESPGFDVHRAFATFGNPNFLAGLLVLALPVAVALAADGTRPKLAAAALVACALIAAGLLATFTRGAWLAAGIEAVAVAVAVRRGAIAFGRRERLALIVVGVALAVVAGVSLTRGGEADVVRRATSFSASGSASERLHVWGISADAALARPITGYGPDSYLAAFRLHRSDAYAEVFGGSATMSNAHDWPLQTAATLGIPAALLLVGAIGLALVRSGRAAFAARSNLAVGVWVGCLGFAVHMLFNVAVHGATTPFWVLLGALAVPAARRLGPGTRRAWAGAAVAAAVLLAAAVWSVRLIDADRSYLLARAAYRGAAPGDAAALAAEAAERNPLSVKYARGHAEIVAEDVYVRAAEGGGSLEELSDAMARADEAFDRVHAAHVSDYAAWAWHSAAAATASGRLGTAAADDAASLARRAQELDRQAADVDGLAAGRKDAESIAAARGVVPLP